LQCGFFFDIGMNFSVLRVFILLLAVVLQAGCATEKKTYDDTTPLEPAGSSEDDSHGWGTSIQGGGH